MAKKSLFVINQVKQEDSKLMHTDNYSKISEQPSQDKSNVEEDMRRLPRRRITDNTKKKMTIIYDKRKEIDFAAQRLEEQKAIHKSSGFTQTSHALAYSKQVDVVPTLSPSTEVTNRALERCISRYSTARLLRPLIALFVALNLMIIVIYGGVTLYTALMVNDYRKYIDLHTHIYNSLQASRKLLRNAIQSTALDQGLVTTTHYNHIADYDSTSDLSYLRNYSTYLEKDRNNTISQLEQSSKYLIELGSANIKLQRLMLQQDIAMKSYFATNVTVDQKWSTTGGQVLGVGALAHMFNQAALNGSWPADLTMKNLYDYLMNNFKQTSDKISSQWFKNETTQLLSQLKATQFFVYAIIFIIVVLVSTGVIAFFIVLRKLADLLRTLSVVGPHDILERMTQLKLVIAKMDKMKDSLYYMCDQLDEGYVLAGEKKPDKDKPKTQKLHFKISRPLFPRLRLASVFLMAMYFLLAGLTSAIFILTTEKAARITWLQDYQRTAEAMLGSYEDRFNDLLALLVLKTSTIDNKPYSEYFDAFDLKVRNNMSYFSQLTSEDTPNSSAFNTAILSRYQSLYSDDICSHAIASLQTACAQVDSQYARQGFAQIERHLVEMIVQVYHQAQRGVDAATVMQQRDYVEIEFAFTAIYEPIVRRALMDTVDCMASEATYGDMLVYVMASVGVTIIVMLSTAISYRLCDISVRSTLHACFAMSASSMTPAKSSMIAKFVKVDGF